MRWVIWLGLFVLFMTSPIEGYAQERKSILVKLLEYRFEPSQIELNAGQETELIMVNEGAVMHEFIVEALQALNVEVEVQGAVIETLGIAEIEVPFEGKVVLRFTPEQSGKFLIACRAREPKDHFKEGMVGRLLIR